MHVFIQFKWLIYTQDWKLEAPTVPQGKWNAVQKLNVVLSYLEKAGKLEYILNLKRKIGV